MASLIIFGGLIKWIKHKIWGEQHKLQKANELFLGWLEAEINDISQQVEGWHKYKELPPESLRIMHDLESCGKMLVLTKVHFQAMQEYGEDWQEALESIAELEATEYYERGETEFIEPEPSKMSGIGSHYDREFPEPDELEMHREYRREK